MRLAFFSPINPQRSGISDYTEELLPFLAQQAEIDLFTAEGVIPTTPEIVERFSVYPHTEFQQRHRQSPYNLCLYQAGNNTVYHRYMDEFIQAYPGIVTLHDYVLHHFYAAMFAEEKRFDEYETAMTAYYGDLGKRIAKKFRQGIQSNFVYYQLPFFQRVVDASLGTIVHSTYVKDQLLRYNPAYQVEMIPMGVLPPDLAQWDSRELRRKHQIAPERFVIASFGFITEDKRVSPLLRAISRLKSAIPDILCMLAGQEVSSFNIRPLIEELGLRDHVKITGYTPYQHFLEYIALSDVCVNLRYPTVRATSANILKLMAFAKPVVTSDLCELLDIPAACCLKIPLNDAEEDRLAETFSSLFHQPEQRTILGNQARRFIEDHHSIRQAAEKYLAFCANIINQR